MDNAVKYGYHFEVLNGYQFEQGDIFSEYVNKMYSLRKEYSKGSAMNLTPKLQITNRLSYRSINFTIIKSFTIIRGYTIISIFH
jgi:DNA polymerase type B, organellar and viral